MKPRLRKLIQWAAFGLGGIFLLVALLLVGFRIAMTQAPQYRERLQAWLNEKTGLVIEFRDIRARWQLYGPELVFDETTLRTPDRTSVLATAKRGSIGLDIWGVFTTGRIKAARLELVEPRLSLARTADGRVQLVGQSPVREHDEIEPYDLDRLPTGRFSVRDAEVSFRDLATHRGPWQFSKVSFDLKRQSRQIDLTGTASLPKMLGHRLKFAARATGGLDDPRALVMHFSVDGSGLDLAGFADLFPNSWPAPESGVGDLSLSGVFTGPRLDRIAAKVNFNQVALTLPQWSIALPAAAPYAPPPDDKDDDDGAAPAKAVEPAPEPVKEVDTGSPAIVVYDRIAARTELTRNGDTWHLESTGVSLDRKESPWTPSNASAEWTRQPDGSFDVNLQAERVVLQNLWPLLAFMPESEGLAKARALDVTGTVRNIKASLKRGPKDAPSNDLQGAPEYSLAADIDNAGFAPVARAPGLRGLSGTVAMNTAGGRFELASKRLQFSLPRLFRETLPADLVTADINWSHADDGWHLDVPAFKVANADGHASGNAKVLLPPDGSSPLIEMNADAGDLRAEAAPRYMPAGTMGPKVLEWLDRAFVVGRVPHATLDLHGPIRNFPFRDNSGLFLIQAQVAGLTLNYQPGWTPATDLTLNVEFRNIGMKAQAQSAKLGGLTLRDMSGGFADFRNGELRIRANVAGDVSDMLKYLQWSPIGPRLGEQFLSLNGSGAAQANADILLPVKKIADRQIRVDAHVADATVSSGLSDFPITRLTGTLGIRQSLIASAQLQGRWMRGPFDLTITPDRVAKNAQPASTLKVVGHSDATDLAKALHLPGYVPVSGSTDWRVQTRLETHDEDAPPQKQAIAIDASLAGFVLDLPAPVGKTADSERPLHVDLEFNGEDAWLVRSSFGEIRALANIAHGDSGWQFDRGTVRADAATPSLPDKPGLRFEGSVGELNLDDWFAIKTGPGTSGKRVSDILQSASLHVESLKLLGHEWRDVRGVLQAAKKSWQLDVAGPQAAGQLHIPYDFNGPEPLTAKLDKLAVASGPSPDKPPATPPEPQDPRTLPAIDASIGDLTIDQHDIGNVELKLARVPDGVRLDSLSIHGASFTADAHGTSLMENGRVSSAVDVTFSSTDVGATLRSLNYGEFMSAKHGDLQAHLTWPGGFDEGFIGRASGGITVHVESGQLLTVQPGAGRLVGLMSVAALPRRLSLDFSDLVDKGLSFDTVHGDFELRGGNAYTSNLLLSGPAAEIGIAGRTGLGTHDYDQTAIVTGKIGSTLPVAGAVIGGPVVGAALLLFSQVFKEPLKGVTRGYYRITGPWDAPVVERVQGSGLKDAAARIESAP